MNVHSARSSRAHPAFSSHLRYPLHEMASALTDLLLSVLPREGATVVDLGCGDEPYAQLVRDAGATYIPCDLEGTAIRIVPGEPVDLPDGKADVVLSSQVLEHVEDVGWYLGECHRLVRPGGALILSTHGTWLYHPHPTDLRRWTRDGLVLDLTEAEFSVEEVRSVLGPLGWTTLFRSLGYRDALRRVPVAGRALACLTVVVMNARIALEERITPPSIRDENACVYVCLARPIGGTSIPNNEAVLHHGSTG